MLERPDTRAAIVRLAAAARFDYRAHATVVDEVLDELAVTFFAQPAPQRADFERWVADEPLRRRVRPLPRRGRAPGDGLAQLGSAPARG